MRLPALVGASPGDSALAGQGGGRGSQRQRRQHARLWQVWLDLAWPLLRRLWAGQQPDAFMASPKS